ncbi:MAG: hypothetical protein MZV63_01160 [Marinilabiliales bacterium]|nr:hypothetical protein [Marinilabiliales bacterium]
MLWALMPPMVFIEGLKGVTDPEKKRKIIGRHLHRDISTAKPTGCRTLSGLRREQSTLTSSSPVSVNGPSATIKSHHNVGGLPEMMHLKVIEPLRLLFKDEVRRVGHALNMPDEILNRHPFPGPGLAIQDNR